MENTKTKLKITVYDNFFKKELTGIFEDVNEAKQFYAEELGTFEEDIEIVKIEWIEVDEDDEEEKYEYNNGYDDDEDMRTNNEYDEYEEYQNMIYKDININKDNRE